MAWNRPPGCSVSPIPRVSSHPMCPCPNVAHAGAGTDSGTRPGPVTPALGSSQTGSVPVKPPTGQAQSHPSLASHMACRCHTATPTGIATPWPPVPWWHLHEHLGTCSGTSKATHPLMSPHPRWHLHGNECPGVTAPMVALPCSPVPHPGTPGDMTRSPVPRHCHIPHE